MASCGNNTSSHECYLQYLESENQLFACLGNNATYSPLAFPLMGHLLSSASAAKLDMNLALVIYKLLALTNDKKLSVVLSLTMRWFDPNIRCVTPDVGWVVVPSSIIWTPEFTVLNPASSNMSFPVDPLVKIRPTGNGSMVKAFLTAEFDAVCSSMNFVHFPFDSVSCSIMLTMFNGRNRVVYEPDFDLFEIALGASSSEWALLGVSVWPWKTLIQEHEYEAFNITLSLKRESFYYVLHLLIPITVSESLVALVLMMPTDQGSKVKLGAMIMLNVYVLQTSVVAILPQIKKHEVPNIVVALYAGFIISVVTLAESVFFHTVHILVPGMPQCVNNFIQWLFVKLWRSQDSACVRTEREPEPEREKLCRSAAQFDNDAFPNAAVSLLGKPERSGADGVQSNWLLERICESLQIISELARQRAVIRDRETKQLEESSRKKQSRKLLLMAWKRFEYTSSLTLLTVHLVYMIYFFGFFLYR